MKLHAQWRRRRVKAQGNVCHWCLEPMTRPQRRPTLDHVHALGEGGKDEYENCVAACAPCNERRGRATWRRLHKPRAAAEELHL